MSPTESFDDKLSSWKKHQETPWARLYYSISRANLDRHLPQSDRPLRFLDVGGANGADAIVLARRGHEVTVLDVSAEMLAEGRRNTHAAGIGGRVAFYQADATDTAVLFPDPVFDVVLCHSVAQYVEDVESMLRAVCQPLRPGGLLSLISINRYSEAFREALFWLDPGAAWEKLEARVSHSSVFDTAMQLRTADELLELLELAGCTIIAQYGIRCVNDYIPNNDIKAEPEFFAQLERLERAMSDRFPYYLLARFFQIIACKAEP